MAVEQTQVLPSPILEASLAAFLKRLDPLTAGTPVSGAYGGIDTSAIILLPLNCS